MISTRHFIHPEIIFILSTLDSSRKRDRAKSYRNGIVTRVEPLRWNLKGTDTESKRNQLSNLCFENRIEITRFIEVPLGALAKDNTLIRFYQCDQLS